MKRAFIGLAAAMATAGACVPSVGFAEDGEAGKPAGRAIPRGLQEEISLQREHIRKRNEYERKLEIAKIRAEIAKLQKDAGVPLTEEGGRRASVIQDLEARIRELESGKAVNDVASVQRIPKVVGIRRGWATVELPGGQRQEVKKGGTIMGGYKVTRVLWDGIEIVDGDGQKTRIPVTW